MINVLFNTWSGAFFNPGGGEVQLLESRRHLQAAGVSVDLFDQWTPNRTPDVFHQFSIAPGVQYPMDEFRKRGIPIALSTILWVKLAKENPENARIKHIMSLADILMTNSVSESNLLADVFEIERSQFCETRNSVADEFLNRLTLDNFRLQFQIEGDFILSVGNIDRRKNTKSLVEACKKLGKQLIVIGEIRDPGYYREIEFSIGCRYIGPIRKPSLLKSAYQQSILFALPSLCETPSIAALEAASQGSRIAITSEGSARDYFGDRVTYFNGLDPFSIAEGIESELNYTRNSSELVEHIGSNYSWAKTAADIIAGYNKLLKGQT